MKVKNMFCENCLSMSYHCACVIPAVYFLRQNFKLLSNCQFETKYNYCWIPIIFEVKSIWKCENFAKIDPGSISRIFMHVLELRLTSVTHTFLFFFSEIARCIRINTIVRKGLKTPKNDLIPQDLTKKASWIDFHL